MVIAADIRGSEEYRHFIFETFKRITLQQPHHSFIFISERPLDPSFIFSKNIVSEVVGETKIRFLSQLKLSSVLKKYKANLLVTAETIKTHTSQILIAFGKETQASIKRTQVIITASNFIKKAIIEKYEIDGRGIDVVYKGVDEEFQPLLFEGKENIIEAYADGNEYFLSVANTEQDNLLNLLKAFSIFKKMQKSGMQLLIVSDTNMSKEFLEAFRLYKFKSEVNVFDNVSKKELLKVAGAAYAFIYPFNDGDYSQVLSLMKCNVPIIVSGTNEMREILNEAALYVDRDDHKDIADKMMLIYKDENLRRQLIEKGREQVKEYSWDKSADQIWDSIQKTVN
jgi:glycosyltransferase involved in cell wall biosynthesis